MISARRRLLRSSAESKGGGRSVNYQVLQQQLESILPEWNYTTPPIENVKEKVSESCGSDSYWSVEVILIKWDVSEMRVLLRTITGDCDLFLMGEAPLII